MLHKREISFVLFIGQCMIVANWGKHCFDSIYSFINRENTNLIIGMDHPVFDCYCAYIHIRTKSLNIFISA